MSLTANIERQAVRMRLLEMTPRFVHVNPADVEQIGEIGALCIIPDERVAAGRYWVVEHEC